MREIYSNLAPVNVSTTGKFPLSKSRIKKTIPLGADLVHPAPMGAQGLSDAESVSGGGEALSDTHAQKAPRRQRNNHLPVYGGVGVVGEVIGKSRPTVFRWVKAGLIPPPFKLKGNTQNLWVIADVIASLENGAVRGG